MVPWDVYMPGDAPRYFGTPRQYADLYGFIRGAARYLDGYQDAGAFGPDLGPEPYGDAPPIRLPANRPVYAVVRALPGQADSPVVIHLVDWADVPRPFDVELDATRLFGQRAMQIQLLTPSVYERETHRRADATRCYDELVTTRQLGLGYKSTVSIPALAPWGLLVVRPAPAPEDGVWQPIIWSESASQFGESLVVHLKTATQGARIHFTIDGSSSTEDSPVYRSPFRLQETTTVRAVAVASTGRRSEEARVVFSKRIDAPVSRSPDDVSLRSHLKLWLQANAVSLPDGAAVRKWPATVGPTAVASPHRTLDGTLTGPPTFHVDAMHGQPAVRFDGADDSLVLPGFAQANLAGTAFTIFMVTQSETGGFGMCGNGVWGSGGIPRLYLQRDAFRYDKLTNVVELQPNSAGPTISVFMHDGLRTISAATNGRLSAANANAPLVAEFGSGGNLAMPFWSGNQNCAGDIAEILVYDCRLTDEQRESVEAYLAGKYGIQCARHWD
jgi:hypothetical protein